MIEVYYGENRKQALEEARKVLGDGYEVIEGSELQAEDLPNVFWGASLFNDTRAILVRDLLINKAVVGELEKYLETKHKIILLETKVDKRSAVYKELAKAVKFREFKLPPDYNAGKIFNIYNMAKRDGAQAVKELEQFEMTEDPIRFTGLLVSQALKDYKAHSGVQEKKILRKLAKLDLALKSSKIDAWMLVKACLVDLKN